MSQIIITEDRLNDFIRFIMARHDIYVRRKNGAAKPWTEDPILQQYRFCNIYREYDTVTEWVHNVWGTFGVMHEDPDLWFAMAVARWVNWPGTLQEIGYPTPWKPKKFIAALEKRKTLGEKVWTGAYMIGTQGNAMDKSKFIAEGVLQPLWDNRKALRPKRGMTLKQFADPIIATKNQGTFMVGQIVADAKHFDPHLMVAEDWWTWAVSGPGSRRGLNRVVNRELDKGWKETDFHVTLLTLQILVQGHPDWPPIWPKLDAQNLQNCLCEFDKYERVRLGQGKPRSRYPGR